MTPNTLLLGNEPSDGPRLKRRKVTRLDDLVVDDYFRWFAKERAPNVNLASCLIEFKNYCEAKGRRFNDYAAAFENSLLRIEEWWLEHHPAEGQAKCQDRDGPAT